MDEEQLHEEVELLDMLDDLHESIDEIMDILEERGYDFEMIAEALDEEDADEIVEGFEDRGGRFKALIAQAKAARRRRLRMGKRR